MNTAIFIVLLIFAVIGMSAVMNAAVKRLLHHAGRSVRIVFADENDFEMQIRSACSQRNDEFIIICADALSADDEEAARRLCRELSAAFCDKTTLYAAVKAAAEKMI